MDKVKLGELVDADAGRDAVHVAILPVVAARTLFPGQRIGITPDGAMETQYPLGIVDPYLANPVRPGERFYLCLFPNSVTSLRHVWTHPFVGEEGTIPASTDKAWSEMWLRVYAKKLNCYDTPEKAYQSLIEGLQSGRIHAHGTDLYEYSGLDDAENLEEHAEVVLGHKIGLRGFSFSCSC